MSIFSKKLFLKLLKHKPRFPLGYFQAYCTHHDLEVPNFDKHRRDSVRCPNVLTRCSEDYRRFTVSAVTFGYLVCTLYGTKAQTLQYVYFMSASADVLALAKIEVKLEEIPEGKISIIKWRGKPLFVRHRTPREIQLAEEVPLSDLRHPEKDSDRTQRPEWLIVIGICTHLGCVPTPDSGDWPGGYYCPCHGSHFDASGRIRKGPAPTNMEVPPYVFKEDYIVIG